MGLTDILEYESADGRAAAYANDIRQSAISSWPHCVSLRVAARWLAPHMC